MEEDTVNQKKRDWKTETKIQINFTLNRLRIALRGKVYAIILKQRKMLNRKHFKGSSRYSRKNQWHKPRRKGCKFFQKYRHKEIK